MIGMPSAPANQASEMIEHAKNAWIAIGPLVGVMIGAWLSGYWDRKKWIKDNRKQECKEVLTAMSKTATLLLAWTMAKEVDKASRDAFRVAFLESVQVFSQSLFIAKDAEYQQVFDGDQGLDSLFLGSCLKPLLAAWPTTQAQQLCRNAGCC
jgi:hypothetical protein